MKKKALLNLFICSTLLSIAGIVESCKKEQNVVLGIGGQFFAINVSVKDTIEAGHGLFNDTNKYPVLNAKNGDEIKLVFVSNDEYMKYIFKVTFTLPDSTKIEGTTAKEFAHTFTLEGFEMGDYAISMSANSTEQALFSAGDVIIRVTE